MRAKSGARWAFAAGILGLGLLLRVWFHYHANPFTGDPQIYGNIARNLIQHGVYSFAAPGNALQPTLIRLPGYPLFLAACFLLFGIGNFTAVLWVQIAVDLAGCLLLARLARTLFGARAGTLCLLLGALCPFLANYTATPLTETLTLATIVIAFFSLDRWRRRPSLVNSWLLPLGLSLSASMLLRPEQALLAVAILPAMVLLARRRSRGGRSINNAVPAALAALCILLPLIPWTARNWRTFHLFQPFAPRSATDPGEAVPIGFQHWYRSWAIDFASTEEVYWNYDGTPIQLADLPSRAFDSPAQRAQTAQLLANYNQDTTPTPALDARFESIARARIQASPLRYYVLLPVARLANMLLRPRTELTGVQLAWWRWRDSRPQFLFATAYGALNLLYLVFGVVGLRRWHHVARGEERLLLSTMVAFVVLRCALLLTLDNSEPRYTLEIFPLLILWASALIMQKNPGPASGSSYHPF